MIRPVGFIPKWYANGLLFENCNCQLIYPAYVGADLGIYIRLPEHMDSI